MAKKENKEVKKAAEVLENISQSEEEQRLYWARLMRQMDEQSLYKSGIEEGKKETAKKMLEKGIDVQTIIEVTGLSKEKIREIMD